MCARRRVGAWRPRTRRRKSVVTSVAQDAETHSLTILGSGFSAGLRLFLAPTFTELQVTSLTPNVIHTGPPPSTAGHASAASLSAGDEPGSRRSTSRSGQSDRQDRPGRQGSRDRWGSLEHPGRRATSVRPVRRALLAPMGSAVVVRRALRGQRVLVSCADVVIGTQTIGVTKPTKIFGSARASYHRNGTDLVPGRRCRCSCSTPANVGWRRRSPAGPIFRRAPQAARFR